MNAEHVNRWLTLSANIGVVIGLILLLIELDQNSDLVRAQIHQARSDTWVSGRLALADTEHLLPAYQKFLAAGGPMDPSAIEALDPIESSRVYRYVQAVAGDYDNLFYQYQQGYLDEEYYQDAFRARVVRLAPVWDALGLTGSRRSFVEEIDRIMAAEAAKGESPKNRS